MSRRKKSFPFFLWHRRLGLVAIALVLILSVTGIMLNHTESLKLDESAVESDIILNWYGINPKGEPVNFNSSNIWISQWNQQLFFNGKSLFTHNEKLRGIALSGDMLAIALGPDVLLVDNTGEVIELMKSITLSSIKNIATVQDKVALLDQQNNYYLSDTQLSRWKKTGKLSAQWSTGTALTNSQITQLKQAYRGEGLKLERVILDLHSGRIFNDSWGIYIMDASAILMILLSFSGLWVWWSRKLKIRRKKHYQKHH